MHGNWDSGITPQLKFGLRDYTPFKIGIMGLQDPPFRALVIEHSRAFKRWFPIENRTIIKRDKAIFVQNLNPFYKTSHNSVKRTFPNILASPYTSK